jgi:N6-L-threonylcarbamoyladenine synthase
MITESVERAISFTGKREAMIVGGVAANRRLVEMLGSASERFDAKLLSCPINFAGDNAVQIAWTGILEYTANKRGISIEDSFISQSWRVDTVDVRWRK